MKDHVVEFVLKSTHASYDNVIVRMKLNDFLEAMEVVDLEEQLKKCKPHPIQEF